MSIELYFVTGNSYKFTVLQKIFADKNIKLSQVELDTPEIQTFSVKEIAEFSARWALEKVKKPLLVNDSGYFIRSLNGFPGPFVKYACDTLTVDDWLKLLEDKKDRSMYIESATTVIRPDAEPITLVHKVDRYLLKKPGKKGKYSLNQLYALSQDDEPFTNLPLEDQLTIWKQDLDISKQADLIVSYLS